MWLNTASQTGAYTPDPLAQFLSRVVPWGTTSAPGFVNVHAFGGTGKMPFRGGGRAYADLGEWAELQNFVGFLNRSEAEVFFCLSMQSRILDTKGNNRRASRKAENAASARSFVLDLDIKPGRYATQRAALAALLAFCDDLGLELGPVVSSGTGIHAYFTLDQPLQPAPWHQLATQLRAAALDKGLMFDQAVTVNIATLLRLPSSTNRKDKNTPRPCVVLQQGVTTTLQKFAASLSTYPPTAGITGVTSGVSRLDPTIFPPRPPITHGPDVIRVRNDLERSKVVTDHLHLYRACSVFADSYDRSGDGDPEPLWYALAKLCHYVEQGRDLFHDLSSGDDRYDEDQTDQKYDSVSREGWPSCQTIAASCMEASALCQGCAFNGQDGSPLNYATRGLSGTPGSTPPSTPYINGSGGVLPTISGFIGAGQSYRAILMPPGFTQSSDSMIVRIDDNARVFDTPVYELELVSARTTDDSYEQQVRAVVGRGVSGSVDRNEFTFSCKALASARTLSEVTFGRGLTFSDAKIALRFLLDWQSTIRNIGRTKNYDRMGWALNNMGFTYGGYTFSPGGMVPSGISKALQQIYTPRGQLDIWKSAAGHLIGRGYTELEALIAATFAAPLIAFTPEDGAVVFGRSSQSGVGKTAALGVGASVWGSRNSIMQGVDTTNSVYSRAAALCNLPVIFDEMVPGQQATKNFNEIVMAMSSGKEKSRLDRSANDRPFRTWRTLMIAAANHSLTEAASGLESNAQAMRIFEFPVPNRFDQSTLTRSDITRIRDQLHDNAGTAGLVYADFLGRNAPLIAGMVAGSMDEFQKLLGTRDDERFWVAVSATIMVGAMIAKKLGLLNFDLKKLWEFLAYTIRQQRTSVRDMGMNVEDPITHIGRLEQFLNEHVRNQIHTAMIPQSGANRFTAKLPVLNAVQVEHVNFFIARIGKNDRIMHLSRARLEAWCKVRNYNARQMIKVLISSGYCTPIHNKKSLAAQCAMLTYPTSEYVLEFDLNKPELQGFLPP